MALEGLPRPAQTVREAGLRADRGLGQHFLLDPAILDRIAALAEPLEDRLVVEIGPGPGGLTAALLARGARVTAVEKDPRCVAALAPLKRAAGERLRIVEGDALELALGSLHAGPVAVVANLPYNVGTALLVAWLHALDKIAEMHLLFQKEVALRLVARPRGPDYGRLSVLAQLACRIERRFDLPPGAFHPPPKVTSSAVSLWPRGDRPDPATLRAVGRVTAAAFGQRRKMLRTSLKGLGNDAERLCGTAGIDPSARAETLAPEQFLELARTLGA